MLKELKKYAEKRAEYHDKKAQLTKENQSYHLGQRDAYATSFHCGQKSIGLWLLSEMKNDNPYKRATI